MLRKWLNLLHKKPEAASNVDDCKNDLVLKSNEGATTAEIKNKESGCNKLKNSLKFDFNISLYIN